MRKFSKLAAGSAILATAALATAGTAIADGYGRKGRVVYERPTDWSGVYFGVQSGYQWSSIDFVYTGPPATAEPDHDDGILGAHLGVQHQFGNIVLGVEGTWLSTFRDNRGEDRCNPLAACGGGFPTARLNDILSVGPRVGWAAGHWMPYITGGYASANFAYQGINFAGGLVDQAKTRHDGWYIGGGFEWKISPGWTAGLEYRHYEFEDQIAIPFTADGAPVAGDRYRLDPSVDSITARVSWTFHRPDVRPLK